MANLPDGMTYSIDETARGWQLVVRNAHCAVTQLFNTSVEAKHSLGNSAATLQTLTALHLDGKASRVN